MRLETDDTLRTAISTLAMTVLLSVILHGLTADVLLGGTTAGSSGNGR